MAERVEALEAKIVELMAENQALRDRIAQLESELGRSSQNSSKPPSSDPMEPRQSRAERRAAARKAARSQGKQPGAPGANLKRRIADDEVPHPPLACGGCGADLAGAEVVGEVRRQVLEIPKIRVQAIDHVAERRRCSCGHETVGQFPPEATAPVCWGPEIRALALYLMDRQHLPLQRTAELLGELLDAPVSTGWLYSVQLEAARRLEPFTTALKAALAASPVVHADETGTRVGVAKHWVHTLSSNLLTLLVVHPKRGRDAIDDIGVLGEYTGTVVHDGYSSYDGYDNATHAQCGAHLLRHLESVAKTALYAGWCTEMTDILCVARDASETAGAAGHGAVDTDTTKALRDRYHACLDQAFALLPDGPPPRRRHTGGWSVYQREAWNLATRMRNDANDILRLLTDTRVPLTNNTAERSLRMVKLHDKISGTFRSLDGAEAFAAARSYIQTVALNGHNRLDALNQLFTTGPWLPTTGET